MFEVIVLIAIPELTPDEYSSLFSLVSLERQERVKRFRFFQDARNCLMGDILARSEICRVTGFSGKQLEFATNHYGKPLLMSKPNVHYNISHAGNYIVCVISDEPVGIDIELVRSIDELQIAECFFTPEEKAYVSLTQGDARNQRFFEVWTKKESRIKWEGKGLSKSLSSFNVIDTLESPEVFYHCVYNNEKAICYVCSNKKEPPTIRIIDTSMLLQHIRN